MVLEQANNFQSPSSRVGAERRIEGRLTAGEVATVATKTETP